MACHNGAMWDQESERLALDVIDGNPGACTIVCAILSSPLWRLILQTLKSQDLIGSDLWRVVHDKYHDDCRQFLQHFLKLNSIQN